LHFLFSLSLFKIQNDVYGSGVGSTKRKQKRGERGKWYAWEKKEGNKRRKQANGRHEERRGKEVKEKR
jgi:hypothetical protein